MLVQHEKEWFAVESEDKLRSLGMHPDFIFPEEDREMFLSDMEAALAGRKSSLSMTPTYRDLPDTLPQGACVLAAAMEGAELLACPVTVSDGTLHSGEISRCAVLGSQGAVDWEAFIAALAEFLAPLAGAAESIGLAVSLPGTPTPEGDLTLALLSADIRVRDSQDKLLGAALGKALAELGVTLPVTVLHTDPARLLGTLYTQPGAAGCMALTVTDHLALCYREDNAYIRRSDRQLPDGCMVVETGAADYSGFVRGEYDLAAGDDRQLERMTTPAGIRALARAAEVPEAEAVLLRRAAAMLCACLGGVLLRTGAGDNPAAPVPVALEADAALTAALRETAEAQLAGDLGRYVRFLPAASPLLGAAAAAL